MDNEFRAMMAAGIEGSGDTSNETSGETADEPQAVETSDTASPAGGATAPPDDDAEIKAEIERLKGENPNFAEALEKVHKSWQRGVTPKLQKAAELERRYAEARPELVSWATELDRMAVENPAQAAAILEAEMNRLRQQEGQYPEAEFMTDSERSLHERLVQMERFSQQQQLQAQEAKVQAEFSKLETEYGTIPYEERVRVLEEMARDRADPARVPMYWSHLFRDRMAQRMRDDAAKLAQQKVALGAPPSGLNSRVADTPAPAASFREALTRALRET